MKVSTERKLDSLTRLATQWAKQKRFEKIHREVNSIKREVNAMTAKTVNSKDKRKNCNQLENRHLFY